MFIEYVPYKPRGGAARLINQVNDIINEYQEAGWDLTLRQLYYQLVSRDLIANTDKEYKRLGKIVTAARRGGLISWEAIEDRTRRLRGPAWDTDPLSAAAKMINGYKINKWIGSPVVVEVWVEKDALAGIVGKITNALDIDYFSTRGYPSDPTVWDAAQRFMNYAENGQEIVVLHLADHDPSGIDMSRDIEDRLAMYMDDPAGEDLAGWLTFTRIGLNRDQISQYRPPANPAKLTDSRWAGYAKIYGRQSWELDALDPQVLSDLISDNVMLYRDPDVWEARTTLEADGKAQLLRAFNSLARDNK